MWSENFWSSNMWAPGMWTDGGDPPDPPSGGRPLLRAFLALLLRRYRR